MNPSVTNPSISDIYQQIKRGELILQPSFQRKFVWTNAHQEAFIDTILQGYPFPEIYVCQGKTDIKALITTKDVIDGQQRLTTIYNYISNSYGEKDCFPFKRIKPFNQLSTAQKESFIEYKVVVRDLGKITSEQTREIFRRINMTKFKLDDIEIQNAIYDGEFIQTAKDILNNFELKDFGVLYESDFSRMADLHYILLIMATLENDGYFPDNGELEKKIAEFNDLYPNKENMAEALLKVFSLIKNMNLELDSLWYRKSSFFTLVVELAKVILENDLDKIKFINTPEFKGRLNQFSQNVLDSRNNVQSKYHEYYLRTYQGTNSRSARIIRSEYFLQYCLNRDFSLI